jgi:hypothetical protein
MLKEQTNTPNVSKLSRIAKKNFNISFPKNNHVLIP